MNLIAKIEALNRLEGPIRTNASLLFGDIRYALRLTVPQMAEALFIGPDRLMQIEGGIVIPDHSLVIRVYMLYQDREPNEKAGTASLGDAS